MSKINFYRAERIDHKWYIISLKSAVKKYCGDGEIGKMEAEDLCKKWNAASNKYLATKGKDKKLL